MNTTAVSIVAAGVIVAGAVVYSSGAFNRIFERPFETALREQFVDPDSVQIRGVVKYGMAWCGEVNAKNRLGAYTGWQRFIVRDLRIIDTGWRVDIESQMHSGAFRIAYDIWCK